MPSQVWDVRLEGADVEADRWFFRDQKDVLVEILRGDNNVDIECKAQYRNSTSVQTFTVEIKIGEPPYYAAMNDLKITVKRKSSDEPAEARIQANWPLSFEAAHSQR
jgi:hypothetical protein